MTPTHQNHFWEHVAQVPAFSDFLPKMATQADDDFLEEPRQPVQ